MPPPLLVIRYLFGGRASTKFVTVITFFGVFIASTALLLTLGIMNGFEKAVRDNILASTPHLLLFAGNRKETLRAVEALRRNPAVKDVYWYATFGAILQHGNRLAGAVLFGIPKGEEKYFFNRKGLVVRGNLTQRGLALGNLLASKLGIFSVPQKVYVISPTAERTPIGFIPRIRKVEVSAIFSSGLYTLDRVGIGYYPFLSSFLKADTFQVAVFLKDPYGAQNLKRKLEKEFREIFITTWIDSNRDFFNALRLQKIGMALVVGLITLVAAFNISSLLITKVRELSKDFAIFRAFGAGRRFVFTVVLSLGFLLGLGGSMLGVLTASLAAYFANAYKLIKVPSDIYSTPYLPVIFGWKEIGGVILFSLLLSLLAALIPAKMAVSQKVTDILRNE